MKIAAKFVASALIASLLLSACGQGTSGKVKLDPDNPVNISIWHYYNGTQQIAFDQLLDTFNQTEGKERGIFVEGHGQGNVSDLETKVIDAFEKKAGSQEAPDIFSSYADTAYAIDQMGVLVDLESYLTKDEIATYVDSFVEEGRIGNAGELRIFPTAKSTEVFMMNKTAWDPFAAETGNTMEQLKTIEGVVAVAQEYFEWTDAKTPEIQGDGVVFYGRDAMANNFIIGTKQLGEDLFFVENGAVTLQVKEDNMRKIWETYYVPYVKGYFASYGRFRADDMKIGEIIAYTGSSSSAAYFPDEITLANNKTQAIDYTILPPPIFESGEKIAVQQGAGMVVTKSTPEREYASVEFLKWFTKDENNLAFGCASGYLPVKKSALNQEKMESVIASTDIQVADKIHNTISACFNMLEDTTLYTNKAFKGGADARKVLEYHLSDWAKADREAVLLRLNEGESLEEATASFTSEDSFQNWYTSFVTSLEESLPQTTSANE